MSHQIRYYKYIDRINSTKSLPKKLLITNSETPLNEEQVKFHFKDIDDNTSVIAKNDKDAIARFSRGVDFYLVQDFASAIADFTQAIVNNDKLFPAYYMRAITRFKELDYKKSEIEKEENNQKQNKTTAESEMKMQISEYDIVKNDFILQPFLI